MQATAAAEAAAAADAQPARGDVVGVRRAGAGLLGEAEVGHLDHVPRHQDVLRLRRPARARNRSGAGVAGSEGGLQAQELS
jgi:hypothetical protein